MRLEDHDHENDSNGIERRPSRHPSDGQEASVNTSEKASRSVISLETHLSRHNHRIRKKDGGKVNYMRWRADSKRLA